MVQRRSLDSLMRVSVAGEVKELKIELWALEFKALQSNLWIRHYRCRLPVETSMTHAPHAQDPFSLDKIGYSCPSGFRTLHQSSIFHPFANLILPPKRALFVR